MVVNSQRTLYGLSIQLASLLGQEYQPLPNTTLNEKFLINPDKPIPSGVYPTINYFTIGVGGSSTIDNSGYSYSEHTAVDAALYEHVPFVLRTLDNDLTDTERSRYRFRKVITVSDIDYVAYYLKVIPCIISPNSLYEVSRNNNIHKLSILDTNTNTFLNPVPIDKELALTKYDEVGYLAKSAKLEFSLPIDELIELRNVFKILYKSEKILTEIGVCSGMDDDNEDVPEANNVQIVYHVKVDIDTNIYINNNNDMIRAIEIGAVEPYIK